MLAYPAAAVLLVALAVAAPVDDATPSFDDATPASADVAGGNAEFHGDMVLTERQEKIIARARQEEANPLVRSRMVVKDLARRWPKNTVPYEIGSSFSSSERQVIESGLRELEANSCFTFKKRSSESDYVYIEAKDGCWSYLGRTGGRQPMSLGSRCVEKHIVMHEFLHALGVGHEHQRPDRDSFIRINYNNMPRDAASQFEKMPSSVMSIDGLQYEYTSIMHYDSRAGSRDGSVVMQPLKSQSLVGTNRALSAGDIKKMQIIGQCSGRGGGGGGSGGESSGRGGRTNTGGHTNTGRGGRGGRGGRAGRGFDGFGSGFGAGRGRSGSSFGDRFPG